MKLKYIAAGAAAAGIAMGGGYLFGRYSPQVEATAPKAAPGVSAKAEKGVPSIAIPAVEVVAMRPEITDLPPLEPVVTLPWITDLPDVPVTPKTALDLYPEPWSREIASGETLDVVLMEAGLDPAQRYEASQAIGKEYDLRRLRPGHEVTVEVEADGEPARVSLDVAGGVQIAAELDDSWSTFVVREEPTLKTFAKEARIKGSISATLANAGIPSRFAVDMANALGGQVNFRRQVRGGEVLRLMWEEERIEAGRVGQPKLGFVALDLRGKLYEAVWEGEGKPTIFEDGEVVRTLYKPVSSARLSSRFGYRIHPIEKVRKMHSGIDFAAPTGTPVYATAPGRVVHAGRKGGYGILVEIAHGSGTTTRYAHLSRLAKGLEKGDRVEAGDMIGRVGSTGNSTGPHLHYEVRVNGKATDPLKDDRLAEAIRKGDLDVEARAQLKAARAAASKHIATEVASLGASAQ